MYQLVSVFGGEGSLDLCLRNSEEQEGLEEMEGRRAVEAGRNWIMQGLCAVVRCFGSLSAL